MTLLRWPWTSTDGRSRRARRAGGALRRVRVLGALAAVLLSAGGLSAQEVRFSARGDHEEEKRLDRFLDRPGYALWTADTVLASGERVESGLLVLGAAARIAGTVRGDVFVVDGDLFLRPGSRVEGNVVVLGGGFYASGLAEVAGDVAYRPNDLYVVRRNERGWSILPADDAGRPIVLHGLHGFGFPGYQRVDEWTLRWGARLQGVEWPGRPSLDFEIRFLTAPDEVEATVRQDWHPSAGLELGILAERATRTNESWVRKGASNSLSFFFAGDDYRNYYQADRFVVRGGAPEDREWRPLLEVQYEKARSLTAREDPFVLFGDADGPPNPAVDDGETISLIGSLALRRRGVSHRLGALVRAEWADSSVGGDFSFLFGEARVDWSFPGLAAHRVELFGLARGDLSGTLPRQRWTAFGGQATLPTFARLSLAGPRAVFVQAAYLVPIEALRVAVIGPPQLVARAATGAAWEEGRAADFEANLSAGVRWSGLELGVAADPDRSDLDPEVYLVLRFPGDL
ncbi:MAG: polymer-forming cytoskeletal protein [Gemmatimonadota bacterium]|nr:polymer-forming cytoskeletal protein [Gemmatimonadota bacterium]